MLAEWININTSYLPHSCFLKTSKDQGIDGIVFSIKKYKRKNDLCFSDTDIVVSSSQDHLSDLNLHFIFINLKG